MNALTGGCAMCGPATEPPPPGLTHPDGTVVEVADGPGFSLTVKRDGRVVGGTSATPACPGLVVGSRRNDDAGGWIDPARTDALDQVDIVVADRTEVTGPLAQVALRTQGGAPAGHAELTLRTAAEGFVAADVAFFDEDGAPLDERDIGFVGVCLDVGAAHLVGGGERFDGPDLKGRLTPLVFSAPGQTESGTNEAHAPVPFFAARVLDVIDTAGAGFDETRASESSSIDNAAEARVVGVLVRDLVERGLVLAEDIGVITPYAAQSARLQRELSTFIDQGLEVDSVDGFQGREKRVIVLSAVRSNESAEVGFLADERRLNVAITRAKHKLVVMGDSAALSTDAHWRALFDHAIAVGSYRSVFEINGAV
jgi:hypothetical protein